MNIITEEDMDVVKAAIMFPIVLDVIEDDIKRLKETDLRMIDVYERVLRKAQDTATKQHYSLRKEMHNRGIKILTVDRKDKKKLVATYLVRGYQREWVSLWTLVKADVEVQLSELMGIDMSDVKLKL